MRQVGHFYKWCIIHQVDFGAPPVKLVADFLMYLFQDRKLQPSTIDGYRSDIADRLGDSPINISKDENLTRLLDSFHWDTPKGRKGIPSWNLSLVFAPADKGHFEPIKEASLKHLTFKTVFLLALGSGKSRSEIHAWQNRNIRHQSDWSRCPCTHHPAFSPRISWPKRVQKVWPQGYNSPGPQLWIDPSSLTGPSVQSEHCATIWTGPRAE